MSRNAYSLRDRGISREDQPDKRQRLNSFGNGNGSGPSPSIPSNEGPSCVLFVGGFPPDWNESIVESVVAGSGHIVDFRPRMDPGGRKNFCFVEYATPEEAEKALRLLSEITIGPRRKLRIELSKEAHRTANGAEKPFLVLDRKFLPPYVNIPAEMRVESEYVKNGGVNITNSDPSMLAPPMSAPAVNVQHTPTPPVASGPLIPEVLAMASKHLPAFNPDAFKSEDKISENLQGIPPPQIIELLSTLKTLIAKNDLNSTQQVFNMNSTIPIAVAQALILMGLIDVNMLTAGLQNATATPQPPAPQPVMTYNQHIPQNIPQPPPPVQQQRHPLTQPGWEHFSYQTIDKLSKLQPSEASMIVQVLNLTPQSISALPQQQLAIVNGIREQYL